MGQQHHSKEERGGGDPPPLYDPVLVRIEAAVSDDPQNLIVDDMEETYDFILSHQIRELIIFWDRADDSSRAVVISGTAVVVPFKILKIKNMGMLTGF